MAAERSTILVFRQSPLMIIAWGIAFILLANSLAPYIVIK